MKRRTLLAAAPAWPLLGTPPATAQSGYPNRPLRYIVPVVAGGGSDMVARTLVERWGRALGQPFVVDNIGGGGGVIACTTAAKAVPDGYTLMQSFVATHGTSPATRSLLPYDAVKDFSPIGMIGATPNVLVVNASLPVTTLAQFIRYLKANPGRVSYGSAGLGSLTHLTMELFKHAVGSFAVHIPYRGVAPAFTDLLGGQTQAMFPSLSSALPHLRSGRLRPLAITGLKRHAQLSEVPTMIESGFAGFEAMQWYGVVGPAGLPATLVNTLNDSLNAVLQAPDLHERLSGEAVVPTPTTPAQFGDYIRADIARWSALARARGIVLDS